MQRRQARVNTQEEADALMVADSDTLVGMNCVAARCPLWRP